MWKGSNYRFRVVIMTNKYTECSNKILVIYKILLILEISTLQCVSSMRHFIEIELNFTKLNKFYDHKNFENHFK